MPNHPNATVAGITGGLTSLLAWALGRWGVKLSYAECGLIVTAATSVSLFIGRRGIKGAMVALWGGFGKAWNGASGTEVSDG